MNLCRRSDPDISTCWKNSFQSLVPHLLVNNPELGLPTIEPLLVPKLALEHNSTDSMTDFTFNNLSFFGAKHLEVLDANINLDKLTFKAIIKVPLFDVKGEYLIRGTFLLFKLDAKGKLKGNFCKYKQFV